MLDAVHEYKLSNVNFFMSGGGCFFFFFPRNYLYKCILESCSFIPQQYKYISAIWKFFQHTAVFIYVMSHMVACPAIVVCV